MLGTIFEWMASEAVKMIDALDNINIIGDMSLIDWAFIALITDVVLWFLWIKGGSGDDT